MRSVSDHSRFQQVQVSPKMDLLCGLLWLVALFRAIILIEFLMLLPGPKRQSFNFSYLASGAY